MISGALCGCCARRSACLSLFRASVFQEWPEASRFDLADVMKQLLERKQLAGFEVKERFYEIGSPEGLAELERHL